MASVHGSNGGDPTKEVISDLHAQGAHKELTQQAVELWFKESQDWLQQAAHNRAALGEQHGVSGRSDNNLSQLVQNATPPVWDDSREVWSFAYNHAGAVYQEFGAMPHEIRAKRAEYLAFEWPDAPEEVAEQFEDTEGDLVFFKKVDHPGIPAIGFIRYGRDQAKQILENAGYDTRDYEEDNR